MLGLLIAAPPAAGHIPDHCDNTAFRDYRIGWRLTLAVPGDPGFEVTVDATRSEPANDNGAGTPVEHGVMLRAAIRW